MEINGQTQLATLIGHPVSHSFSPYIHNFLAEKYRINLKYIALDVQPEHIQAAVKGMGALGIIGSNVTIPHKVEVIKSLDEVDKQAQIIGAVNTIKNHEGKLIGYNTDGVGFIKSLTDRGCLLEGKQVMILGAGGASRAIAVALATSGVKKIILKNHRLAKAEALAGEIKKYFQEIEVEVGLLEVKEEELNKVDYLINTTPIGMSSRKEECPINQNLKAQPHLVVCDIVYNPHQTQLLKWAEKNNLRCIHGIGMLIYQALYSFYIWTGIDVSSSYEEVYQLLLEKKVIG